ncbi:MAG: RIP metalloprotease RseP [Bacilli bacterium]|nr:RIP metalloprotease RseP [Bacilli bacterium]
MTIIYFILILGVIIFVHELGHFLFAKKAGIYIYEFAIGMGPKLFGFKRKNDETDYTIRLIPLGGYVKMAGEEIEEDEKIPKNKRMQSKTWIQRFLTIIAGALFNFLLAILLLFLIGIFYGSPETKPVIGEALEGYPAYTVGVKAGDTILSINNSKISSWDDISTALALNDEGKALIFKIKTTDSKVKSLLIKPVEEKTDGVVSYKFGITMPDKIYHGIIPSIKYAFVKTGALVKSIVSVLQALITGNLSIDSLAGPVGIYGIVDAEAASGFGNIIFLVAYLSIQVGFINLIPFPAFDGGRVLFLVIEKIKGSKVNPKVENIIHAVGFGLLILLMIIITIKDIKNLFI